MLYIYSTSKKISGLAVERHNGIRKSLSAHKNRGENLIARSLFYEVFQEYAELWDNVECGLSYNVDWVTDRSDHLADMLAEL
jgi:hypothetical protein